jgi:hypothetical protein
MQDRVRWLRRAAVMAAVAVSLGAGLLAGASPVSAAAGVPGAPTGVSAVPRDQGALVSWTPPSSDGGSPVTGYVITASPGGKSVHTSVVTSFLVGGLVNGTAYTFTVAAVNASGTGPASSPSATVTPKATAVPGPPRSVAAVAGFQQATVSWAPPKSDGGAPVTGYKISTSPATAAVTVAGSARSAVVTGLADGTAYKVQVAVVNSVGAGKAVASAPVTPKVTVPSAPLGVTAAPAASGVTVGWQPPTSAGGSAVSGYVVAVTGTTITVTAAAAARSVTVTGLTAGTSYTFTVAAQNGKGRGSAVMSTPATAGATVGPKTVVLSAASLATLTLVGTDGSLVFTKPTSQVQGLAIGDVVVAGVSAAAPDGLLAKVTSVTSAGSTVTVATTPASLNQALSSASFGGTAVLGSGQVTGFTPARRGVRLAPAPSTGDCRAPSFSVTANVTVYKASNGRTVSVQGGICVLPRVSFSASVTPTHITSDFTGTVTATASAKFTAQLSHDFGDKNGLTLGYVTFAPIRFFVGYVPIVIVPTLSLKLVDKGTVSAGVSAGVSKSLTLGAHVTTSDAHAAATPVYSATTQWDPPQVFGSMEAAAGIQANLSTKVDGVPGPTLTDTLWIPELTVDTTTQPWWTLDAEDVLDVHYKLVLLGHPLAVFQLTLLDKKRQLAAATDPYQDITITPSPAVTAPGGQLQLHAQVAGAAAQNVQWNAPTGNGTITTTGLYTAPTTPGTYQITAAQPASGLKPPAYGLVSIQVGDQPPGPPTSPAGASTSYGAATITWTAPADTGGGTITGYTVTAQPGGASYPAPGSAGSDTISGLTPGATYTFTITATTDGGTSLPSPATSPVVIDNAGAAWTATEAPLPANAALPPYSPLLAVACPSATSCIAVGSYDHSGGASPGLLVTGSGTSWTATQAPLPGNASQYVDAPLQSIACPSTTSCVAAGYYDDTSVHEDGYLVTGSGTSWAATQAPLPANAAPGIALLQSVACASTTSCVAVGTYTDSSGNTEGLVLTGSGTSWTATEAPLPADATAGNPNVSLGSVACPSTTSCIAIGTYLNTTNNQNGLLLTETGTSWAATEAPLPANAATGSLSYVVLESLACPSATSCVVTGSYADPSDNLDGLLLTGAGTSWAATEAPLPANATTSNLQVGLPSVACASTTSCVAVGTYVDLSGYDDGLVLSKSGTSWTATQAPPPPSTDARLALSSVACAATTSCLAIGTYDDKSTVQGVLLTGSGTSWTATKSPVPADAATNPSVHVSSVACPVTTSCTAIGTYDDQSGSGNSVGMLASGLG